MANTCLYNMQIKGKDKETVHEFLKSLKAEDKFPIGLGAEISEIVEEKEEDEGYFAYIRGNVRNSIESALINRAVELEEQRSGVAYHNYHEGETFKNAEKFLTLFEACEKYEVNIEGYSQEEYSYFQEHFKYEDGESFVHSCTFTLDLDEKGNIIESSGGYKWLYNFSYPKEKEELEID